MKKLIILIIIFVIVQAISLSVIYTFFVNRELELDGYYNSGYNAGTLFNQNELNECLKSTVKINALFD